MALIYSLKPGQAGTPAPANPLFIGIQLSVCAVLAVGIAFTIWVIWPRRKERRARGQGVVDAERIYQCSSGEQFSAACQAITDDRILKEAVHFVYDTAEINRQKYYFLKWSILVSAVGWIGALFLATWMKFLQM